MLYLNDPKTANLQNQYSSNKQLPLLVGFLKKGCILKFGINQQRIYKIIQKVRKSIRKLKIEEYGTKIQFVPQESISKNNVQFMIIFEFNQILKFYQQLSNPLHKRYRKMSSGITDCER
ncbi:unnamed protein product [Paramecium octaurelia]|uniref:Uncharacterized protein n=1 Tax=Paramecium octaurelia TaxID=43137 RepID=A0A8S1THR1_PAROT|nr:unnamed protein product [Paramecium octaurelia]